MSYNQTTNSGTITDIPSIKVALQSRIGDVASALFKDRLIIEGQNGYRVGNRGSIAINRIGLFHDKETNVGGDTLDLIQHALKCDFKEAIAWARTFLGTSPSVSSPNTIKQQSQASRRPKQVERAREKWSNSVQASGTLAEIYLNNRGIVIPPPASLGFLLRDWNHTSQRHHPALVASIENVRGELVALQTIHLSLLGKKISGKGVSAKLIHGAPKGGAVRLSPLKSTLIVCEGIEDGLSILQALPDACVWATCGTSGLINLIMPDVISDVIIASDNDASGAGQKAAHQLAMRLKKEGRSARIATPTNSKDFNELLEQGNIPCATSN